MARIAIDTNVFVHLTNPQENPDSHIEQMLSHLAKNQTRLCVDSTKKIGNEYEEKLGPRIRDANETGIAVFLLRFWMNPDRRDVIDTDPQDHLMQRIRKTIPEADEHADRAFVYVSCKGDCPLVSNDHVHIIGRRSELRKRTRDDRGVVTCFQTSREHVHTMVVGGVTNQHA